MSRLTEFGWARATAEFVVIVTGVLLALAVDDWRESGRDSALEDYLLERIEHDLDGDIQELETTLASAHTRIEAVTTILRALGHEYAEATGQDSLNLLPLDGRHVFTARDARIFDHQDGAFRELLATGGIQVLSDLGLRSAIADYYGSVIGIIEINEMIRQAEANYVRALAQIGVATDDARYMDVDAPVVLRGQDRILAELREVRQVATNTVGVTTRILTGAQALRQQLASGSAS